MSLNLAGANKLTILTNKTGAVYSASQIYANLYAILKGVILLSISNLKYPV